MYTVTGIVPPASGWPAAYHCAICRLTTFLCHAWLPKPEKGIYYLIEECPDHLAHNHPQFSTPRWRYHDHSR